MNEAKAIDYLGSIFRFDKYEGSDGNYELISNYWGMKFNVRIREFTIFLANTSGGAKCSIDNDEDETTIARELTAFIGEVLKDESSHYVYDGTNGILAWPYNCNFAYIKYIKQCFDMNSGESDYEYMGRKLGKNLGNSRKPIKSGLDTTMYALFTDGGNAYSSRDNGNWYWTTSDNDYYEDEKDFKSSVRRMAKRKAERNYGEYDPSTLRCKFFLDKDKFLKACEKVGITPAINSSRKPTSHKPVDSSMQGQERGIQAIMDEYGCSREEAIDIMNSEVTSGCHGKAKKKNKKEIKSSLVDEFEDSYCNASNEWPEEERHSYEDSFINGFAKDHGITYDETKKMLDELQDKWYKDADNAGIVDIYSSTRRNITNVNRIFG